MSEYRDRMRELIDRRKAEITASVLNAIPETLAPESVTSTAEFELSPAIALPDMYGGDGTMMVSRVVVTVTRYPTGAFEDDGKGYIKVTLHGKPMTKAGTVRQGARETWVAGPEELAAPLLLAAMTRTRV